MTDINMGNLDRLQAENQSKKKKKKPFKTLPVCSEPDSVNATPRADRKCVSSKAPGMDSLYLVQSSLRLCSARYSLVICRVSLEQKWVAKVVILLRAEEVS